MAKPKLQPAPTEAPRFVRDIEARLPGYQFRTFMDVGANIGHFSIPLARAFPEAKVYAFEPVRTTFETLKANTAAFPNIEVLNLALGARSRQGSISAVPNSTINRLTLAEALGGGSGPAVPAARPTLKQALAPPVQAIEITTGAEFLAKQGIGGISCLKIDTEGHDYEVVKGFGQRLATVDFVQVEAGMNEYNRTHVALHEFQSLFDLAGFYLFRIYGEAFEFKKGGRPVSRRCNPLFINRRLVGDMDGIS
ncbi:MAG: methyltransferase FkbM family [Rubritepida sp.]|nr:methyltransferase FkbM family [Rubritepida sp.]